MGDRRPTPWRSSAAATSTGPGSRSCSPSNRPQPGPAGEGWADSGPAGDRHGRAPKPTLWLLCRDELAGLVVDGLLRLLGLLPWERIRLRGHVRGRARLAGRRCRGDDREDDGETRRTDGGVERESPSERQAHIPPQARCVEFARSGHPASLARETCEEVTVAAGIDRPPWRTAMLAAPREGSTAEPALSLRRPSCAARISGEVVRGLATTALIGAWLLAAAACGAASPGPVAPRPSVAAAAAAAANTPCAAVTATTALEDVSPVCQQVWGPYGVTDVPPWNELTLEHVPAAPAVTNLTGGLVSDAVAQHWADASNWDSGWWKWAQRNDQLFVLRFLVGPAM